LYLSIIHASDNSNSDNNRPTPLLLGSSAPVNNALIKYSLLPPFLFSYLPHHKTIILTLATIIIVVS
jgi:hypothetical protein